MHQTEPTKRTVIGALDAGRVAMNNPTAVNTEFGWASARDDTEFLRSVDLLLGELGVQFAAREIESAHEIKALRVGLQKYVNGALAAAIESPSHHEMCDHDDSLHDLYGCQFEDRSGGVPIRCDCESGSGFPQSQHRGSIVEAIARKTGDYVEDPKDAFF
jgi:hypothetical protein